MKLSIVIPDSSENSEMVDAKRFLNLHDCEVIFVSHSEGKTRAARLNVGFNRAKGEWILFHHPRSLVEIDGIKHLEQMKSKAGWGAFTHQFDNAHPLLKFTSWYSNRIRGKKSGVIYLDHCIFFHRSLWRADIPNVEIFEDTLLSYHFLQHSKPQILPFTSTTSAIRFTKNGIWKQAFINQILKMGFHFRFSDRSMNKIYERGLPLNTKGNSKY